MDFLHKVLFVLNAVIFCVEWLATYQAKQYDWQTQTGLTHCLWIQSILRRTGEEGGC